MTDRDHFAAAALTGLIANGDYSVESAPILAYRMADAMLRQRGNQSEPPSSSPVTEPIPKEKRAEVHFSLTDAEREAIECALICVNPERQDALRGLLERSVASAGSVSIGEGQNTGEDEWFTHWYLCPKCDEVNIARPFSYCPNCGVKLQWPE